MFFVTLVWLFCEHWYSSSIDMRLFCTQIDRLFAYMRCWLLLVFFCSLEMFAYAYFHYIIINLFSWFVWFGMHFGHVLVVCSKLLCCHDACFFYFLSFIQSQIKWFLFLAQSIQTEQIPLIAIENDYINSKNFVETITMNSRIQYGVFFVQYTTFFVCELRENTFRNKIQSSC